MYMLKKSPHTWLTNFNGLLFAFGFTLCIIDPTMFSKKTKGGLVILVVYIDDMLVIWSDNTSIHATKTYLQYHLSISLSHNQASPIPIKFLVHLLTNLICEVF